MTNQHFKKTDLQRISHMKSTIFLPMLSNDRTGIFTTQYSQTSQPTPMFSSSSSCVFTTNDGLLHQIFIKTCNNTIVLDVRKTTTILDVKKMIFQRTKIPIEKQKIVFSCKQLENTYTLEHYQIQNESTLHMVFHLKGGSNLSLISGNSVKSNFIVYQLDQTYKKRQTKINNDYYSESTVNCGSKYSGENMISPGPVYYDDAVSTGGSWSSWSND